MYRIWRRQRLSGRENWPLCITIRGMFKAEKNEAVDGSALNLSGKPQWLSIYILLDGQSYVIIWALSKNKVR